MAKGAGFISLPQKPNGYGWGGPLWATTAVGDEARRADGSSVSRPAACRGARDLFEICGFSPPHGPVTGGVPAAGAQTIVHHWPSVDPQMAPAEECRILG